ncbi:MULTISPECIES: sensor histidine kinase [Acinetobacter]|uniref:sensor histidine kinase n=1 Tax=Acinetobacter TaxID=469 RepID=UPI0002AE8F6B|nr:MULTISPECIES: HAMP domain-containing sensor histidine kinase [Acinetobacter]ELW82847.1 GHKL domain protein [Acinetobacter sp. WC-743]MBJ8427126.1 HAMP domain-containing histidine kinase [Acinetobacter bereziniae]MBJ8476738.1 HAMP domain-containing histidine kinase [Acinetobacter bereziniae]
MKIEFLDSHQTEQLSACRLSLILGAYTPDNKIERYLKIVRAILNVENAFFSFHNEPYAWVANSECDFVAAYLSPKPNLLPDFQNTLIVEGTHPSYPECSDYITEIGLSHTRLIAYDFRLQDSESIAHVYFYDHQSENFSAKQKLLLEELSDDLVTILQRKSESQDYYELYEQERALNFSKTKFFQVIAHDLRAPFHGLIGFSDVLANERETLDEENIHSIAQYLHDTLQSTYALLENLLNWAMSEGGRFVYHPINFKLKQTTKIVYDVLQPLAVNKNIQLIENVADDLTVFADMNMVTSIIQNLVSNALKFTQTDGLGKVTISAQPVGNRIEIIIHDTGLGMTQAQIEQVFEPQLKASIKGTIGEQGTGLGLVLCKRFVDLNHGQISVSSQKGEGTTFVVALPAAKNAHQSLLDTDLKSDKVKIF